MPENGWIVLALVGKILPEGPDTDQGVDTKSQKDESTNSIDEHE